MTNFNARTVVAGVQPAQILAIIVAIAALALGIYGFIRTGFSGEELILFGVSVNPLQNLIYLGTGVLGLLFAIRSGLARLYGWLLLVGYGAAWLWGLLLVGVLNVTNPVSDLGDPLRINTNDNWIHFGFAVAGLIIALLPVRRKTVYESTTPPEEGQYTTGQASSTSDYGTPRQDYTVRPEEQTTVLPPESTSGPRQTGEHHTTRLPNQSSVNPEDPGSTNPRSV